MASETAPRTERLWIRLTAQEATQVADRAAARGLTVSDLIRDAVFKHSAHHQRVGRRAMSAQTAQVIRELSAIAKLIEDLLGIARETSSISQMQLDACLVELRGAIAAFGR